MEVMAVNRPFQWIEWKYCLPPTPVPKESEMTELFNMKEYPAPTKCRFYKNSESGKIISGDEATVLRSWDIKVGSFSDDEGIFSTEYIVQHDFTKKIFQVSGAEIRLESERYGTIPDTK